jgi:hypothetical protein
MMPIDDSVFSLSLCGYVVLSEPGFALPCYAHSALANTWYVARCSVPGDHLGNIVAFDRFTSADIQRLPPHSIRQVHLGSQWCDVFLGRGGHFVGNPFEIWDAIRSDRIELSKLAPLSFLDAAIAAESPEWGDLATNAYGYLQTRFGESKAKMWRTENFIRPQVLMYLGRLEQAGRLKASAMMIRSFEIEEDSNQLLTISMNKALQEQLHTSDCFSEVVASVEKLAAPFGMAVEAPKSTAASESTPVQLDERMLDPNERVFDGENILLVSIGERAREIAKHFGQPEWVPTIDNYSIPKWRVTEAQATQIPLFESREIGRGDITICQDIQKMPSLERYAIVVALVDDEILFNGAPSHIVSLIKQIASSTRQIGLLAPALPSAYPSKILLAQASDRLPGWRDFAAIIDTSIARSPFWPGTERRSLERRVADVIVGAAMLATLPGVRDALTRQTGNKRPPLMSFTVNTRAKMGTEANEDLIGMGSEASWSAPQKMAMAPASVSVEFGVRRIHHKRGLHRGLIQLRQEHGNFNEFAHAILMHSAANPRIKTAISTVRTPQAKFQRWMAFPEVSAYFHLQRKRNWVQRLALVAETPNIKILKAAAESNWTVVRYSDHKTIQEIFGSQSQSILPREILLPKLQRIPANRRLATRGIDPRDVLSLSTEDAEALRRIIPSQSFLELRPYRAQIETTHKAKSFAIPYFSILEILDQMDQSEKERLLSLTPSFSNRRATPKRRADLELAWAPPAKGLIRFIISDGILPLKMARLSEFQVPAQGLFFIDGDIAVPALLQSRVFAVWAHSTLTRSTSWMDRFSVRRTFETFPIRSPFELIQDEQDEGPTLLVADRDNRNLRFDTLCHQWLDVFEQHRRLNEDDGVPQEGLLTNALRRELDGVILAAYGLPAGATDLDILDRLLEENAKH